MYIGNMEVYGIIYDIRNKINNKHYIGQTTRTHNRIYYKQFFLQVGRSLLQRFVARRQFVQR